MAPIPPELGDEVGPAIDEVPEIRDQQTLRRRLEYSLFASGLLVQVAAIVLRSSGNGFVQVVVSNWVAMLSYLLGVAGVFVRYRGWDRRKSDRRNHTYYLLFSPLAGIALVGIVGRDEVRGFIDTAALVPGMIASSLAWGWAHNSRMAPRAEFVEATETARGIFWGWAGIILLTGIQLVSERIGERYQIPDLLLSMISIGAFLLLVSTGYTQYIRAQDSLQRAEIEATLRGRRS